MTDNQQVSVEQATLHFLSKAQIHASEVDLFIAVRNHFASLVQSQASDADGPVTTAPSGQTTLCKNSPESIWCR